MALSKKLTVVFTGEHPLGFKRVSGIVTEETSENGEETISLKLPNQPPTEKQGIEFSRYKQECKKRALELAVYEQKMGEELLQLADKYYNWLISIPEK